MRGLGFTDARRTGAGADRGVDVTASDAVAQVKYLSSPVGSPDIQRFRGAAHLVRNALFYSWSGYTRAAHTAADELGVALFEVDEHNHVQSVNHAGNVIVAPPPLPPARERTLEERDEDALLAEVHRTRFITWAWRSMSARGRTKYWDNAYVTPDRADLELPDLLDRLPLEESRDSVVAAIRETQAVSKGLLNVQHAIKDRARHRDWTVKKVEWKVSIAQYIAENPGWQPPEYTYVEMPDLRRTFGELAGRLAALQRDLIAATSQPAELRRLVLNEARALLREEIDDFHERGYPPSLAWPA